MALYITQDLTLLLNYGLTLSVTKVVTLLLTQALTLSLTKALTLLLSQALTHFPSRITEYLQTPVGLLSNIKAHRSLGGPLCMPSDGQHSARSFRRATFREHSNSIRTTVLASPTCPGSLRHGPRLSCHEKARCLEFFEDLVREVSLLREKVSILPCCVAHRTLNVRTRLKVRP